MLEQALPFVAALIWGFTPIFYKHYISRIGPVRLNLLRTIFASTALSLPFLIFGLENSIVFGSLSGLLTLALGDTLFFVSIAMIGASIATPILYIQIILIQFLATLVGEPLSPGSLLSGALIILGVYLFSRGGDSPRRVGGVVVGLGAALLEAIGQVALKPVTLAGINPLSIAFSRSATAAVALAVILLLKEHREAREGWRLSAREYSILALLAVGDIAFAASLYIYSIGFAGIVFPTLVLGLSPLITQLCSRALKKESPRGADFLAGVLVVVAIAITML